MHAETIGIGELQNLVQRASLQFDIQVELLRRRNPIPSHIEMPEVLSRAVRSRRRPAKAQFHRAIRIRSHLQISVIEIEDRLRIAKFEIDPARAHLDRRNTSRCRRGRIQQILKIPGPLVRFHEIDRRIAQPDRGELQVASKQTEHAHVRAQGSDIRERLDPRMRILMDRNFVNRKPRHPE